MQKSLSLGVLFLFLGIFITSFSLAWSDNGQLIQNITGCGILNTTGATYTLNQSISQNTTCMNITASNIILDGAGYLLSGNTTDLTWSVRINSLENITIKNLREEKYGAGIYISYSVNVTIQNCSTNNNSLNNQWIDNNAAGVVVYDSSYIYITNHTSSFNYFGLDLNGQSPGNDFHIDKLTAIDNTDYGIYSFSVLNSSINNSIISLSSEDNGFSYGILCESCSQGFFLIKNNTISNYSYGIKVDSNGMNITNNQLLGNYQGGIYLDNLVERNNVSYNVFNDSYLSVRGDNNTIVNNTFYIGSIVLVGANNNSIYNNTIQDSSGSGIIVYANSGWGESSDNTFDGGSVSNAGSWGIEAMSPRNYFQNMDIFNNSEYGILASSNTTIENCTIYNNAQAGVYIYDQSSEIIVNQNTIRNNSYGIQLGSAATDNLLVNNDIYNNTNYEILDQSGGENYLEYFNAYGDLIWLTESFLNNLTTEGRLIFGDTIVLEQNRSYFNASAFSTTSINSEGYLYLYSPALYLTNTTIQRNGIECNELTTPSCDNYTALNIEQVEIYLENVSGDYSILGYPDIVAPNISLIAPANNTNSSTHAYNFTFNATDNSGLAANCTLYIDDTVEQLLGNVYISTNESNENNGIYNGSLGIGSHNWTINCSDYSSNIGSSQLRTFNVLNDSSAPNITLLSIVAISASSTHYNFTFSVEDSNPIDSCNLTIDESVVNSMSNISRVSTNGSALIVGLNKTAIGYGTHTWSVNCSDDFDNIGTSAIGNFVLTQPAEDTGGSGGGGGGGGATTFWISTITAPTTSIVQPGGYSFSGGTGYRVKLNVSNEEHFVGIINLTNSSAIINISSETQQATLIIGETKDFEINGDGYYDLRIGLKEINSGKANLSIQEIHEQISSSSINNSATESSKNTNESGSNTLFKKDNKTEVIIICAIIFAVLIIILYFVFRKKH